MIKQLTVNFLTCYNQFKIMPPCHEIEGGKKGSTAWPFLNFAKHIYARQPVCPLLDQYRSGVIGLIITHDDCSQHSLAVRACHLSGGV